MKQKLQNFIGVALFGCIAVLAAQGTVFGAAFTINSTDDVQDATAGDGVCETAAGNGICTLRAAITESNALAGADTITLPAGVYTLTLTTTDEDLNVNGDLDVAAASAITINGADARTTIVQAGTVGGAAGNGVDRVFDILAGGTLALDNITVRNGRTSGAGGGLRTAGTLTVNHCTIANNRTTGGSGGGGFEILTATTTTILNSTITGNSISASSGGGIRTIGSAQVLIANTTISGNTAAQTGGAGMRAQSGAGGLITMTNCTVTGNTLLANTGGGLSSSNTFRIRNTIVSGNTAASSPDVGAVFTSGGNNLIGVQGTSTGWITTGANADLLNNTNAGLQPLGANGGSTDTHAIASTSSALNAGQNCVVDSTCVTFNAPISLTTDQRGYNRLYDGPIAPALAPDALVVDIGAYELQPATAAAVSISGRVLGSGKGLANAKVELTGTGGGARTVTTNSFGNFTIPDVPAGAAYVINISAKKYTFAPQVVSVTDNISGLIFTAQ